jgi:hypothetical protein
VNAHIAFHRHVISAAVAVVLLAGCSGIRPYPNDLEKNLQVRTQTRSGSMFEKVRAAVDIYRVNAQCRLDYQGTVDLDKPALAVGIPAGRLSYLVFNFASSSFLGGNRSRISQETLLEPRIGYRYDIDVSYRDDIYNVVVRERHPHKGAGRELGLVGLGACEKLRGTGRAPTSG